MSASLRVYDIVGDLPWDGSDHEERRFRRILWIVLALFVALGLALTVIRLPKVEPAAPDIPPRIAKLVLEKKTPPPPPPKKEEPKPEPVKAEPVPKPAPEPRPKAQPKPTETPRPAQAEAARQRASKAGVLAFQQELASLRDTSALTSLDKDKLITPTSAGDNQVDRVERALIAAKAGKGSGGIDTASLSRDTGGAGGSGVGARTTTQVASTVAPAAVAEAKTRSQGKKAARSDTDIQLVFDRNKSALYALYNRALRNNPALQGKVVLRLTIAPSGEVTKVELVSSELGDPDLERRLLLRVKQFDFGARDVEPVTITYPINFLPS